MLVLVIVTEGRSLPFDPFDNQAIPDVPPARPRPRTFPTPQLHLPALTAKENRAYQLASTRRLPRHRQRPGQHQSRRGLDLVKHMATFPDAATVAGAAGLRRADGDPPPRADRGHAAGRRGARGRSTGCRSPPARLPGLVVYEVGSSNASPGPSAALRGPEPAPATSAESAARAARTTVSVSERQQRARRDQPEGTDMLPRFSGLISYRAICGRQRRDAGPAHHGGHGQPVVREQGDRGWPGRRGRPRSAIAAKNGSEREPGVGHAEGGEDRVLEAALDEPVGPGADSLLADQRVGQRADQHEERRRDRQPERQGRQPRRRRRARWRGRAARGSGTAARACRRRRAASSPSCR